MEPQSKPGIAGSNLVPGAALEDDSGSWARYVSLGLGAWLMAAAFLLTYSGENRTNAALTGLMIALTSLWAVRSPQARRAETLLATWLFFSTLVLHRGPSIPAWNNILCAIATFVLSLVPGRAGSMHVRT
jgi:hypothetical protein